jgi:FtsP/CotA-like multicopper oxidase with cupredoxin domain
MLAVGAVVLIAVAATLAYFWKQSLLPDTYSVMDMGYHDYGGGEVPESMMGMDDSSHQMSHMDHGGMGEPVSVETLTGPSGQPDESVTLTAREGDVELGGEGDRSVSGYTINDQSPGPTIVIHAGDLLEVTLVNESVSDGITLHWHGVDVPKGEDGVAGVTQDAVEEGEKFVYRFVVDDPGTYWYHSHQVSDKQVSGGLFGPLVVLPKGSDGVDTDGSETGSLPAGETLAVVHSYDGNRTVNGVVGTDRVEVAPGQSVLVRIVNTNDGPLRTWVTGSSYTVMAIDARPLNEPQPVTGKTIVVPAGGRADLLVQAPSDGDGAAVVDFGGGTLLAVGPADSAVDEADDPENDLDLLSYAEPEALPFDPADADRHFTYSIGRRPAFLDGKPGFWWTINGHLYPDIPMYVVEEGDLVVMTIENHSGQVHPMHLHGHHAVVLSRDGEPATGSPWWIDSLDVQDGETYDIAFVADNPGVWMDHCHNLPHASQGLVTHLMYAGVTTPYVVGGDSDNDPE